MRVCVCVCEGVCGVCARYGQRFRCVLKGYTRMHVHTQARHSQLPIQHMMLCACVCVCAHVAQSNSPIDQYKHANVKHGRHARSHRVVLELGVLRVSEPPFAASKGDARQLCAVHSLPEGVVGRIARCLNYLGFYDK